MAVDIYLQGKVTALEKRVATLEDLIYELSTHVWRFDDMYGPRELLKDLENNYSNSQKAKLLSKIIEEKIKRGK